MWVKLDDGFPENPKVDKLTDGAFRLHISALCHAQKWLTDGLIEAPRVGRLMPSFKTRYVAELVKAGLWEETGGDYLIHDFAEFNRTRAHWLKKRADDAERLADWRAKKRDEEDSG